jgi:CheY-like chemotaxis protein
MPANPSVYKPSIMVVEDEVLVRLELVDLIQESGFEVYEAGNADEAIKMLEQNPHIQVLITDIDMPGSMDGLKLSHYVRHRWPPVHIIVTSGHVRVKEADLPLRGLFLNKPYETPKVRLLLAEIAQEIHGQ